MKTKTLRNELTSFTLYGPALIIFIALSVCSTVFGFFYSFTDWDGLSSKFTFVGLANFIEILHDENMLTVLKVTFLYTLIIPLFQLSIALILAIAVDKVKKFKSFFRGAFFFPYVIASAAVSYIWTYMFYPDGGVINTIIGLFIKGYSYDVLRNMYSAIMAISVVNIWQSLGFYMIIFLAGLQSVPEEIYESANIDGASEIVKFFKITLPMLSNTITVCLILSATSVLKLFDTIIIMTKGGPGYDTTNLVYYIYYQAYESGRQGYGAALGVVLFLIIAIVAFAQAALLKRGEVEL